MSGGEKRWKPLSNKFNKIDKTIYDLVKLWILANRLLIPALQNLALETLSYFYSNSCQIPYHCLNYIYENLAAANRLRMFVFVLCAENASKWEKFCMEPEMIPKKSEMDPARLLNSVLEGIPTQISAAKEPKSSPRLAREG
jgi:hypothetical protein